MLQPINHNQLYQLATHRGGVITLHFADLLHVDDVSSEMTSAVGSLMFFWNGH